MFGLIWIYTGATVGTGTAHNPLVLQGSGDPHPCNCITIRGGFRGEHIHIKKHGVISKLHGTFLLAVEIVTREIRTFT